jgi:hypothetical protein
VPPGCWRCLAVLGQLLYGILADCLQHGKPRLTVRPLSVPEQALIHKCGKPFEALVLGALGNGRGPRDRPAINKHREVTKEPLLRIGEQRVAPLDGAAKGLLTRRQIAQTAAQQLKPLIEPRQERGGGEEAHVHCRELDRQRQPVETRTDPGHGERVRSCEREVGANGPRPIAKEPHRVVLAYQQGELLAGLCQLMWVRYGKRRDGHLLFAGKVQRLTAGHQDGELRCLSQQLCNMAHRGHHLLKVVEQQ